MTTDQPGYILPPEPPKGPLTARNLQDFAECPRKYLLSFFATRRRTVEFIGGPAALHRAVRAAVLEMYAAGGPTAYSREQLLAAFEANWDGSVCEDSRQEEDLHRDGLRMLQTLWEHPLPMGPDTETDRRLEGEIGGQPFVAVADLLCPDPPRVVRLTTSRRPPSPGELQDDPSWTLLYLLTSLRLPSPALVAVMADLRKGRQVEYTLDAQARARAQARLVGIAERIRREREFPPLPGNHCRWCRSRPDCPARRQP